VIGRDRLEDLQAFLRSPAKIACRELLCKHEIRSWIRKFE